MRVRKEFFFSNYVSVCGSVCEYVHVSSGVHRSQRHPITRNYMWVLGTETRVFGRAECTLNL